MAIVDRYAGVVFDIDGVLTRQDEPLPGAPATVANIRRRGAGVVFATNNASRTPGQVADELAAAGIPAAAEDVVTSAAAAAELLASGTRCLVIGTEGLRSALRARGCALVHRPADAEAVVVGWDRSLTWDDLRRATVALAAGARFLATNADLTYPAAEGLWPGNGAIVVALEAATGRQAEVAGKPHPPMFRTAAARLPEGPLLMVGDRHETDVAGAAALGWDTALVLTGVTAAADGLSPAPTYVFDDLRELTA